MKLPKLKTVRTKADNLLTPIIKLQHPQCLLCGKDTEVAHHHVHKSKSTRLRYDFLNLINLCNSCHYRLHQNESYWASVIVEKKGLPWFQELNKRKDEVIKADIHYFIENHNRLQRILQGLEDPQLNIHKQGY